jgi:predicted ATPase
MKIFNIHLKNFKAFKNMTMQNIPHLSVIVGANGTGKSSIIQVFDFLKAAFLSNINNAFHKIGGSNGMLEVRSRNTTENIEIEIQFIKPHNSAFITYALSIGEKNGIAFIEREILKYQDKTSNSPVLLFEFSKGRGSIVMNETESLNYSNDLKREDHRLKSDDILALKVFAQLEHFPVAMCLGNFIESWHISNFNMNHARLDIKKGYAEHLSLDGSNLSLVTEYLYKQHPQLFQTILLKLSERIPGIENVEAKTTEDGRVLIRFKDGSFENPFSAHNISDGTLKMFAYLVLLYDPKPHSLLCVEEPENQLYSELLWELAEEFRAYTTRDSQVFISTHSPGFLNAIALDEVFWLVKKNGYTTIYRVKNDDQISSFMKNGDQMGYLWEQGFFEGIDYP